MKNNSIIFIILFFINICNAQYTYDITINLSESGWSKQNGKLKTTMLGDNGKYNETIILSNSEEKLSPADHKKYNILSNIAIDNIDRIELRWTTQSMYIIAPNIFASSIDLIPLYLDNYQNKKISFCASNKNQKLVAKESVPFWIKC